MRLWMKIFIIVLVLDGLFLFCEEFMQWQWDHTLAPFCWNPYMVVDGRIEPSIFFTPYLNDWISWLPPSGWKTGVYVYNFLNLSLIILKIVRFLVLPIVVFVLRKRIGD